MSVSTQTYGSTSMIISRLGTEPADFGFDDVVELEEFIERLQTYASGDVVEFTGQLFDRFENHVDVIDGTGRRAIKTKNYPVLEIHEIAEGSSRVSENKYQLEATSGRPDRNAGVIKRLDRRRWSRRQITIEYDWGYDETPSAVDSVVEDMVVEALERHAAMRESQAKQTESMDGFSVTYALGDVQDYMSLTESMQERLRPLKRRGRA